MIGQQPGENAEEEDVGLVAVGIETDGARGWPR